MTMSIRFTFLLLAPVFLHGCCRQQNKITPQIIYQTINEIIRDDSLHAYSICREIDNIRIPEHIRHEYFKDDGGFVTWQLNNPVLKFFDTGKLNYYSWRQGFFKKSDIDSGCVHHYSYSFSKPIFSHDLNTIAIKITSNATFLSGWSYSYLFQRRGGKWVKIKIIEGWIS